MASIITRMDDDQPVRRSRSTANLLAVTTLLELVFGTVLLVAPTWMAHLLTGAQHTSAETAVVLRNAAAGVLAIGFACALGRLSESGVPRSRPLDLVPGLFVYYGCAVVILADALMRRVHAPLLWPAMALHSALLVWCIVCLAAERTLRR
jgi:Na+-driven multidrug efflux pump